MKEPPTGEEDAVWMLGRHAVTGAMHTSGYLNDGLK